MNQFKRSCIAALLAVCASGAALAQAHTAPRAAADSAMLKSAREIADMTAGQVTGSGASDKLIYLQGSGADLRIVGLEALALGGDWPELPKAASAVVRTRASLASASAPPAADVEMVRRTGLALFLVGEDRKPARLWEVRRDGDAVFYREIDARAAAGPWRQAGSAP
jgi:hypothetical protein